jgi:pimeloyl-ACP methyl ester carboxylesterase
MRKQLFNIVNVIAMVTSASCAATTNKTSKEVSVDQEQVLFEKSPKEMDFVASDLLRPQEPKPPYSYNEEAVKYSNSNAGISLAATLTLPRSEGPHPVVLLIAGSGPNDRNEAVFGHKPFLVLADHLTKQGIAVLRFDKRGCDESTGNYDTATSRDFADDVLAGIDYLKTRKEIDARWIGLIGHSEGGIIAPMVAVQSKDVAFIVLMAGTGVNGEEILYAQGALVARSMGASVEAIAHQEDVQRQILAIIKKEPDSVVAEKLLREVFATKHGAFPSLQQIAQTDAIEAQIKRLNTNWFRYFLTYEPATSLKRVKVPVLVLNGELDLQVPPNQNLPAIEKALKEAGNKDYSVVEFPKLNHLFQNCETGSIAEYQTIEETIAPIALNAMSDWILQRTSDKRSSE